MTGIRWFCGIALMCTAVAACGQSAPLKPAALVPQLDKLVAANDTVGLAILAERQCAAVKGVERQNCYEEYFTSLAGSDRVHVALGALSALAERDHDIERDGHGYTHIIGIRAWKPGGDVSAVFRGCTGLFQSGCYHGVIQSYLTQGGDVDSNRAVALCDNIAPKEEDRWLRFQCVHGIGHGFEMAWNWDLVKALKGCDWLNNNWDRSSCYGGAFMENAVASMPGGHHTSVNALAKSAAAEDSSMKGMAGMAGMNEAKPHSHSPDPSTITFKMRDSNDVLYPCSIVGDRYLSSCYSLQGGLILDRYKNDFTMAAAGCDKAPAIARSQCYQSLGTNSSGMTVRNTPQSIANCSHGDPVYQPFCFIGVVKNFIDVTSKPEDGIAFCRAVPAGANKQQCYIAVGEQISVLFAGNHDAKLRECVKAAPEGEMDCRRGAAVL